MKSVLEKKDNNRIDNNVEKADTMLSGYLPFFVRQEVKNSAFLLLQ